MVGLTVQRKYLQALSRLSSAEKSNILDMSLQEVEAYLERMGLPPYRGGQILRWIYRKGAHDFQEMTDISMDLREKLSPHLCISIPKIAAIETSLDGTRKFLMRLADGLSVESVLIPERGHITCCASTQVGCAQKCQFCLTARMGLLRNLTSGEIVGQILALKNAFPQENITNVVLMGMGEPLANLRHTLRALEILTSAQALGFSRRHVTVSTVGLIPGIRKLGVSSSASLAVSLNATTDEARSRLMPVNRRYPLDQLMAALRTYPLLRGRRITVEYVMIAGVNDTPGDARRLVSLLHGIRVKVNLIPLNEAPEISFARPDDATVARFQNGLLKRHIAASIRKSKGTDIRAACGQLQGKTCINW
jgi:23S rRNA (adenine2503-C2)-methyltransferase